MNVRRTGLTLVELVATLAVTSMLLVATLTVFTKLSRSMAIATTGSNRPATEAALRSLMTCDLLHATACEPTETAFRLQTTACLDPASLELSHLPAVVEYRVEEIGSRHWLVRVQSSQVAGADLRELVCSGVTAVRLDTPMQSAAPSPDGAPGAWRRPPSEIVVSVQWDGSDELTELVARRN